MPEHRALFVEPRDGQPSPLLKKAFDSLKSRDINPQWTPYVDALRVEESDKYTIYVTDPFEGEAFRKLEKLGCRMYGPACVLSCSEAEKPLPKQNHPLYSLSMRGLLVCFSNLENEERERLMSVVRYMGGDVLKGLTEQVTHLVTNQVGSKKYIVATSSLKLPIMKPEWVEKVWQSCKLGRVHGASEEFKKFACPIFMGIYVSVSGLDQGERKRVQVALETNGGNYSGEMRRDRTTHLITTEAKGQKYNFASKWKIHIVHPQWLHDSLHEGYCRDESLYNLKTTKTSTPTKTDTTVDQRLPSMDNMSYIMSSSMMNVTSVNETMNNSVAHPGRQSIVPALGTMVKDILEDLQLKSSDLLDGCKVYLSGFCGERLDKIRKFVSLASGTRLSVLNDDITHIVVNGKAEQSLLDDIKDLHCQPHVVSLNWLVECQKHGKLLAEEDFACLEKRDEKFSPIVKRVQKKNESVVVRESGKEDTDMSDLLSQYMSNAETTRGEEEDDDVTRLEDATTLGDETIQEGLPQENGLLGAKTCIVHGFEPDEIEEVKRIVDEMGGRVLKSNAKTIADYAIVPPFGCPVNFTVDEVVTSLWLQECHQEERLLDLNENLLYRPIPIAAGRKPLESCVLAITGFMGMERDCLLKLAETLGAVVQEYFCKKTSSKMQASTHLLASIPDGLKGSKYEAATKMNVPVVTKEWLLKCAETGSKQSESEYRPVTDEKTEEEEPKKVEMAPPKMPVKTAEATPTGRRSNQRVLELQESERAITPKDKPKDVTNMTPNTALKNIQFDLTDMLQEFETPASKKKHSRKSSLPLEDLYNHHINIALRRFENPEEFQSPAPASQQSQDNDSEKPLSGVIIAVSKKLTDKQGEYFNLVSSLGGDYRWAYDSTCTHYICQGKHDTSKDYKQAKEKGKYIVSPYWLIMCEQQNSRVDEGLFPANFNPSMSLCVTTPRPTPVTRRQARLTQQDSAASPCLPEKKIVKNETPEKVELSEKSDEKGIEDVNDDVKVKNLDLDAKTPEKNSDSLQMQQVIQKELEDIMANTKNSGANSAPRRKSRRPEMGNRSGRPVRPKSKVEEEDLCSQQAEVTWDDPNSRREREKFEEVLHKPYSPTQNPDTQPEFEVPKFDFPLKTNFSAPMPSPRPGREDDKPPPTPEPPSLTFPRPKPTMVAQSPQPLDPPSVPPETDEYRFLLSGMTPEEKVNYGSLIEQLCGVLMESNTFDVRCTHLITGQPTRNEKCLAGIASGKWILHKSYLEACKSAGTFVKEDDHEWGSAGTLGVKSNPSVVKLAEAAHRWRVKLQRKKQGAFHEWRVIICTPKAKTGGFRRLLEAGGARVLTTRPPFADFLPVATHSFMDLPKCEVDVDLSEFVRAGVQCYKPEFIAGFLMDEFLDSESYIIPELRNNNNGGGKKRKSSGSTTEVAKKTKMT